MFVDMPDPLRSFATERLSVAFSPVLECLVSLFALQNPDVFPRGRSWRKQILPELDENIVSKLSFYFPEGYFAFNMGVFASFLIAPLCSDMEEFVGSLSEYAQRQSPLGLPTSWGSRGIQTLEQSFRQTHNLLPPRHLYERYQWCISHQEQVLRDILFILHQYWGVFLRYDSVWRAAVNKQELEIKKALKENQQLDLVELCSDGGRAVLGNYVLEKLRSNPDHQVVLMPSFFTYPYVANLDQDSLFFLIVPTKHSRDWQVGSAPLLSDGDLATIFKALSDETRLAIICLLKAGPRYGLEIAEALGITQPTASHHLSYLAKAQLVQIRKEGLYTYYYLNQPKLRQAAANLLARTEEEQ